MKIYSSQPINYFKAKKNYVSIEWVYQTEDCTEDTYTRFRIPQNKKENNWFRNLKLINKENKVDDYGRYYDIYHISYERKYEYHVIEINDKDLQDLMDQFGSGYALYRQKGKFFIDVTE